MNNRASVVRRAVRVEKVEEFQSCQRLVSRHYQSTTTKMKLEMVYPQDILTSGFLVSNVHNGNVAPGS